MYFESGLYYGQVKRYFDLFNHENIKIIIFEDMIKDIQKSYQEISKFLNIEYEKIDVIKENESKAVYGPLISFIGRKINDNINKIKNKFFTINKKTDRDKIIYFLQKDSKPSKLDEYIENKLSEKYLNDIEKLEYLINKDLSIWK